MVDGSQPGETLRQDALSTRDLLVAGMSYMAPGFSFFFTTALIASAAGVQTPLTYLLAGLGVLAAGAAFAEFSRHAPSAGSLQVFVQRGFGRRAGTAAGIVLVGGYLCLQAGVLALFGGWTAHLLEAVFSVEVPWPVLSLVGLVAVTALMVRGVGLSIKTTWVLFLVEFLLVAVLVAFVLLRGGADGFTTEPLDVAGPDQGWSGIALGMVFAVFSFVGFEGAVSFAEETPNPRRALPIAVLGGVVIMVALYVLGTYAAVIGFGTGNIGDLAGDPEPIATLADTYAPVVEPLLELAVFTSIAANLMAAGNANARILFNMGRERIVAEPLGHVHRRFRTPALAITVFMALTAVLCLGGAVAGWDYLTAFGSIAGFGAFLAILVYMVSTAALPLFVRRQGLPLNLWRHLVLPAVGTGVWLIPLWGSLKPGQAFPASVYPWVALAVIVLAAGYAALRRTPAPSAVPSPAAPASAAPSPAPAASPSAGSRPADGEHRVVRPRDATHPIVESRAAGEDSPA